MGITFPPFPRPDMLCRLELGVVVYDLVHRAVVAGDADGGREARVVCVSVARVSRRLFNSAMHVMYGVC